MTIILDRYPLPDKGTLTIRETVTIRVSAEETRRAVDRWLLDQVSYMLGAEEPVFVIGAHTGWQVPVVYSAPHIGRAGIAGYVKVDAQSGEILDPGETKIALEQEAKALAKRLPPFRMSETPVEYLAGDMQPTRGPGSAVDTPGDWLPENVRFQTAPTGDRV